jgi:hypothetical protein
VAKQKLRVAATAKRNRMVEDLSLILLAADIISPKDRWFAVNVKSLKRPARKGIGGHLNASIGLFLDTNLN